MLVSIPQRTSYIPHRTLYCTVHHHTNEQHTASNIIPRRTSYSTVLYTAQYIIRTIHRTAPYSIPHRTSYDTVIYTAQYIIPQYIIPHRTLYCTVHHPHNTSYSTVLYTVQYIIRTIHRTATYSKPHRT